MEHNLTTPEEDKKARINKDIIIQAISRIKIGLIKSVIFSSSRLREDVIKARIEYLHELDFMEKLIFNSNFGIDFIEAKPEFIAACEKITKEIESSGLNTK